MLGHCTAYEELMAHLPIPTPDQVTLPARVSELEFLELAHAYDSLGLRIDDLFKIKEKRIGPHRVFILQGVRYKPLIEQKELPGR